MPMTTDDKRSQRFFAQLNTTIIPNVMPPNAILPGLAKSFACSPPLQLIILTFIRLMPISAMTLPVIIGVKSFFSGSIKRLTTTGTSAATTLTPNSMAIMSCGPPPCAFTHMPPAIATPRKAKLVPCIQIIPAPIPQTRLACRKVPIPEAISDILIKYGSHSPSPSAAPIISGGVIMPTSPASTCCKALKKAGSGGMRCSRP